MVLNETSWMARLALGQMALLSLGPDTDGQQRFSKFGPHNSIISITQEFLGSTQDLLNQTL